MYKSRKKLARLEDLNKNKIKLEKILKEVEKKFFLTNPKTGKVSKKENKAIYPKQKLLVYIRRL